jgi:LuxR family transcriptional regulator, maltose regulon positive regulatory protein
MPPTASATVSRTRRAKRPRAGARDHRESTHLIALAPAARRPFDVFESKLRVPPLREGVVSRTGLVNRLRAERAIRLATVVAPAGYGKTTLLAQWAERDERPFAWLSIDERDNDPLLLLRHVAAAFEGVERLDDGLLDALAAPGPSLWSAAAPRLASAVSSCTHPFVVVLDDAHLLHAGDSADVVLAIAESIPEGSVLALSGRVEPPLPIARLRAAGRVLEVGADELALGRREGQLLLRGAGLHLEEDDLADLLARSEGWAAGLYLAARTLGARGAERTSPPFAGVDRGVAEYLYTEHLAGLSSERLEFMRRSSVLEQLSGPLCDAVLERAGSAVELGAIERSNLFLAGSDTQAGWYRFHRLFRDVLRRELEQHEPELVSVLNGRAADWFESRGDLEHALDYAQAAGDVGRAARILAGIALPVYHDGRSEDVEAWLDRFAAGAELEAYPVVAALGGWIHALQGHAVEADRWLDAARRGVADGMAADDVASARAWITLLDAAMCAEGVPRMEQAVDEALPELSGESWWLPAAFLLQGAVHMLGGAGDLADVSFAAAAEAAERSGAPDVRMVAIAERSLLAADSEDYRAAEQFAFEARDLLATGPLSDYATGAIVRAVAARAFLRHGRWDDARRELALAERLAGSMTHALPWLSVQTRLALGAAYVTLRDRDGAHAQLDEMERVLELHPHLGELGERVAALRRQIDELPDTRQSAGLTRAELRLLPLLATHLSFREIGDRLYVSRNTIKTQAISVYRKLGVSSRSAAIQRASGLGLVADVEVGPGAIVRRG